ncbi:MAG: hypothetical protein FWB71_02630 [Defluviitaleaceae bacterium]|nr:hypothetical protein [Defluviitaleaceae bacterium]
MARIQYPNANDLSGVAKEGWDAHVEAGNLTNMKKALLLDEAVYEAYMGWYKSWSRLVELVGKKTAMILAHSVSSTNDCLLCSLFFVRDLKAIGINPADFVADEKEELLAEFGKQIVKNPTKICDDLFAKLKKYFNDKEIVVIVGFIGQMMATNNFNSVLQIDVDEQLLPLKGEFTPATWREDC